MAGKNSIDYFKNTFLKNGIAKPSRYEIEIFNDAIDNDVISFQPETVQLPARAFVQVEDNLFFGPVRRQPIGRDFTGQVVFTFPVSDTQGERAFFEAWMDKIVHPTTQQARYLQGSSFQTYGSMVIKTLNNSGDVSSTFKFEECYPATVMPVSLGYGMRDDYTRLTVAMEFRQYTFMSNDYETGYF